MLVGARTASFPLNYRRHTAQVDKIPEKTIMITLQQLIGSPCTTCYTATIQI
jgi:hypothetical protein